MEAAVQKQRRRVKISRSVRVRPSDFTTPNFDEIRVTLSASPDGFYFTTWRDAYYKGMRVFVTYPYSTSTDTRYSEYVGEVVCVETLANCRRGVAIRFLMSLNPSR